MSITEIIIWVVVVVWSLALLAALGALLYYRLKD